MSERLPVVLIGKKLYFVDERLHELRNIRDPFDRESIELAYSPSAKRIHSRAELAFHMHRKRAKRKGPSVAQMRAAAYEGVWRCHGHSLEPDAPCPTCGRRII